MGFQIKTLTENDRFFAIDIWSTRIKVLLCELESGKLNILEKASIRQSRKHMYGGDISDLQGVSETLEKALHRIEKSQKQEVCDCIFSIQSPSLVTDAFSMNYVRDKDSIPLGMEEIDSMVARIEVKSLEKVKPKILSLVAEDENQMKLVTTSLTSITIDGKKVSNPIGFTGKNISLTVCNVFLPSATFHLYSTIARNIGKRILSFVPTPIALPKAQNESLEIFDPNSFVDIGHSLTSITLENYSELLWAVQIPIGSWLYESMLVRKFPKMSRLEIEHLMQQDPNTLSAEAKKVQKDFIRIFSRALVIGFRMLSNSLLLRNVYLSGWIAWEALFPLLQAQLGADLGNPNIRVLSLLPDESGLEPSYGVAYALARTTQELVRQQADPIARILRYVIYRYE